MKIVIQPLLGIVAGFMTPFIFVATAYSNKFYSSEIDKIVISDSEDEDFKILDFWGRMEIYGGCKVHASEVDAIRTASHVYFDSWNSIKVNDKVWARPYLDRIQISFGTAQMVIYSFFGQH